MARTLYTLTQVKEKTGISLPTLQKYKKTHQDRIPSVGEGRSQRYPPAALQVFKQLKAENLKKRGRPRKATKNQTDFAIVDSKSPVDEPLTLKQVSELTGISYPTLARYIKISLSRIPHVGKGRKRRYPPDAVSVFKTLYEESRRGRRKQGAPSGPSPKRARAVTKAATASNIDLRSAIDQLKEIRKVQRELLRKVEMLEKEVRKPFTISLRRS